jgi:polysaccharide export outer membrane protein
MLKTPRDFQFDSIPMTPKVDYIISPNDVFSFRLFANDGFKVIDLSAGTSADGSNTMGTNRSMTQTFISYLVRQDGEARLPMLGDLHMGGMTKLEAEMNLEKEYSKYYVNPYVQIQINNQRVFVFPGNGADAQVISLENNNTTLLEAIAKAGGISSRGRAKRVKIIRQNGKEKDIYQIDLSTIGEGLKHVRMIMQANDIVYVEPVPEISKGILNEVAPIVSLLSSAFLIYFTINNIK